MLIAVNQNIKRQPQFMWSTMYTN